MLGFWIIEYANIIWIHPWLILPISIFLIFVFIKTVKNIKKTKEKASNRIGQKQAFRLIIDEREKLFLTRLFISAGYTIIGIYIALFVYAISENIDYSETAGTVIAVYPAGEKDGKPVYKPAVHYIVNGESFKADLPDAGDYKYGDTVKVMYDIDNPLRIGKFVKHPPLILLVFGIIPLVVKRKELKDYWVWYILDHPGRCMLTIGTLIYAIVIFTGSRYADGFENITYGAYFWVLIFVLAPLNLVLWLDAASEEMFDKYKPLETEDDENDKDDS